MTDTPPIAAAVPSAPVSAVAYRVLARKYRPGNFTELIGQDALVRTLSNAIASGRIHQAYMLTGVRGVGKTTTARIMARALNCIGPDGQGGPTITPCGMCEQCQSISQDRNVDVVEMDAASNTSVDNIREIIDGARYAPAAARYKIYVIDEVHMLSKNAFNALLKTLEEPPPHVKFVFATTEIRKVPVTVLSRCQRFDLRRVEQSVLSAHFAAIAAKEGVSVDAPALAMIARAADGSVRDGLSLLDQAIALADGTVTGELVRDMLGLADRGLVADLIQASLTAEPAKAMTILDDLHRRGAEPVVILQDMLDFIHFLTRCKVTPALLEDPTVAEIERQQGTALAGSFSVPALTRAWQILLKGLAEVQAAPIPMSALEMVLIRLAHAADLPDPGELVRRLVEGGQSGKAAGTTVSVAPPRPEPPPLRMMIGGGTAALAQPVTQADPLTVTANPVDFAQVVALFGDRREGLLRTHLHAHVHLVHFEPGRIEVRPTPQAPADLAGRVGRLLSQWTGQRWVVSISSAPGQPTLAETEQAAEENMRQEIRQHPAIAAVLNAFPGARIETIRETAVPVVDPASPEAGDHDMPPSIDDGEWEGEL